MPMGQYLLNNLQASVREGRDCEGTDWRGDIADLNSTG